MKRDPIEPTDGDVSEPDAWNDDGQTRTTTPLSEHIQQQDLFVRSDVLKTVLVGSVCTVGWIIVPVLLDVPNSWFEKGVPEWLPTFDLRGNMAALLYNDIVDISRSIILLGLLIGVGYYLRRKANILRNTRMIAAVIFGTVIGTGVAWILLWEMGVMENIIFGSSSFSDPLNWTGGQALYVAVDVIDWMMYPGLMAAFAIIVGTALAHAHSGTNDSM